MSVAAVVVVHDPVPELARCLEALIPQVDELVVVDNLRWSRRARRPVIVNERPVGFAANANRGIAETSAPFVIVCNPDTEAAPDAVAVLRDFAESHPRAGIVGPELRHPRRHAQPVAPAFSHRRRHDRPPHAAPPRPRRNAARALRAGRAPDRAGPGRLAPRRLPPAPARDARRARRLRRGLPPLRRGHRPRYRAAKAGWERWYVPQAKVVHAHQAVTDRRPPDAPDVVALARDRPLRPQAPGAEGSLTAAAADREADPGPTRAARTGPRACVSTARGACGPPVSQLADAAVSPAGCASARRQPAGR